MMNVSQISELKDCVKTVQTNLDIMSDILSTRSPDTLELMSRLDKLDKKFGNLNRQNHLNSSVQYEQTTENIMDFIVIFCSVFIIFLTLRYTMRNRFFITSQRRVRAPIVNSPVAPPRQ